MKKIAFFLTLSLFLLHIPIVTSMSVETTLIISPKDYETLGIPLEKIQQPYTYERHVLCNGHLPLAFSINSPTSISLSKQQTKQIMLATPTQIQNISNINLSYYILVNTTYTYEEPVYKQKTIQETQIQNDTKENITIERTINELVRYETITDYKYIWKELKTLSSLNIKPTDTIIIDIRGTFKASTTEKKVDIIPTLSLGGFQKTYNEYAWWDSDWTYKKQITIDHNQVPSTLTNFPVLINITDSDLASDAQSDGDDIAFITSDETTQLNHEIEYFNDATGELVAWVNVTSLAHDSDTTMYMYYGNAAAANQEDVTGTWNSDYIFVSHMNDASGGLDDKTSNANDYTENDNPSYQVDGLIKYGIEFDGVYDAFYNEVDYGDSSFTLEAWCYADAWAGDPDVGWTNIMDTRKNNWFALASDINLTYPEVWIYDGSNSYTTAVDPDDNVNEWHYYVATREKTDDTIRGIFDGIVTDVNSYADVATGEDRYNSIGGYIKPGIWSEFKAEFDGKMDEVRISTVNRSTAWLNTVYNNINNATDGGFFTIGEAETNDSIRQGISISYPSNNSSGHCPCALSFCFTINNSAGHSMDCDVFLNTTHQTLKNILHLSSVSNGTYCFCSNTSILYNTTYTWYINVTDQVSFSVNTSDIYTFTTTQNIADCNTTASTGGSNESWLIGIIILFSTFGIIAFVKQNKKQR